MQKFWPFVERHWLLCVAFVILFIAIIVYERMTQSQNKSAVSVHEAVGIINRSKSLVLDLRSEALFVRGHIIKSRNMSLAKIKVELKTLQKFKAKPVIVIASNNQDVVQAIKVLETAGFEQVLTIKGGLRAWSDAKLPLEKKPTKEKK